MKPIIKQVALVISTFNWPSALELVLESVVRQTKIPDEILVADDGSYDATRQVVAYYQLVYRLPIKHVWQPDQGYRKSLIINKAIRQTSCDYIIQIDGDMILHRSFIADHLRAARRDCFVQGSRVLLDASLTKQLIQTGLQLLHPWSQGIRNRINAIHLPGLAFYSVKKPAAIKISKPATLPSGKPIMYW